MVRNRSVKFLVLHTVFASLSLRGQDGVSPIALTKPAPFLGYVNQYFEHTPLTPRAFIAPFATTLPTVEAALGFLLVVGLLTRFSQIAGGPTMTALVFGANLAQDSNNAGLQLIYCFIFYYLLAHRSELNAVSFDALRGRSRCERFVLGLTEPG